MFGRRRRNENKCIWHRSTPHYTWTVHIFYVASSKRNNRHHHLDVRWTLSYYTRSWRGCISDLYQATWTVQWSSHIHALLRRSSVAVVLTSVALGQIWMDRRHKPTGILLLGLAALTLGQSPDQCQSVPSEYLHVWIPTNLVTDLCINDKCAPALCILNTESEYSQMPSNNDIIFEDSNCNIRHPVFWEQWLEHNFGSNSQQDYLGDIDNDGLVNILEYHGKWAFEDAFLDVGPNVTRNPPVCNCLDAPGEQPGEPQVIPLTWDEVISESSDPK